MAPQVELPVVTWLAFNNEIWAAKAFSPSWDICHPGNLADAAGSGRPITGSDSGAGE
jgi:hypothetical protein